MGHPPNLKAVTALTGFVDFVILLVVLASTLGAVWLAPQAVRPEG